MSARRTSPSLKLRAGAAVIVSLAAACGGGGGGDLDDAGADAAMDASDDAGAEDAGEVDARVDAASDASERDAGQLDGDAGGSPRDAELAAHLRALGVDTEPKPLEGRGGEPIPEDAYSPLGARLELGRVAEVFALGAGEGPPDEADPPFSWVGGPDATWASQSGANRPGSLRSAAAGDFLGDGLERVATVHVGEDAVHLGLLRHDGTQWLEQESFVLFDAPTEEPEVRDLALVAGDFDGDGVHDLALGYVLGSTAHVRLLSFDEDGELLALQPPVFSEPARLVGGHVTLELAAGRLDYDNGEELALVMNEVAFASEGSATRKAGRARYFVLDDAAHDFRPMRSGDVQGEDGSGALALAAVGDVAIGNIDDDPLDEVVLSGLSFEEAYTPHDLDCERRAYVVLAIDDAANAHPRVATARVESALDTCDEGVPTHVERAHVAVLRGDGTERARVAVNELSLEFAGFSAIPFEVKGAANEAFMGLCAEYGYSAETSEILVGDFTGEGREQLLAYCTHEGIFTLWEHDGSDVTLIGSRSTGGSSAHAYPVLVATNVVVDEEAQVLELLHDPEEPSYVIGEPIVLAALAAPPCQEGIGQNTDACVTTFGSTEGIAVEHADSYRVGASAGVGMEIMGGALTQSEVEFEAKVGFAVSHATSEQQALSKSVTYTTGAMEDTVVFAAVPYHRFLYRVRAAFDASLVGRVVSVLLPSPPVVLQAERGFFNDHVLDPEDQIGDEVFSHRAGDISSYPTRADIADLLIEHCQARDFPECTALQQGPQAVGQGAGSTELGLEIATESGLENELALSAAFEAETTVASVKVTMSLETERAFSLGTSVSQSTAFTGEVGAIDAAHFADHQYSFGLAAYAYGDKGRFHVVQYWVED